MSLQEVIAGNQKVVAAVAALVFLFAGYRVLRSTGVVETVPSRYYFNLDTGETYAAPISDDGIVAHVYACGDCSDAGDRFVAYLEKLTDAARAEAVKEYPDLQVLTEGKVIAAPGQDPQWVTLDSPAGADLTGVAYTRCESPVACTP